MHTLSLYTRYAFRSFLRGKSRSVFGAFCIAVGITAVVALGLTGGNFRNAVTGDARKLNRADVSASPAGFGFTLKQYRIFQQLKDRGEINDYTSTLQDNNAVRSTRDPSLSAVGSLVAVDSKDYPYYDTVTADAPAGTPIARLLSNPNAAVVGHDVLDSLHLRVGDSITVNTQHGFTHRYTVVGVVPDSAPNPGFGAGFWNDFVMVDKASVASFFRGIGIGANIVDMKTRSAAQAARVKAELERELGGFPQIKTVADVANDSKNGADAFDKFFRLMGLVAVVIGGIGIINTSLVAARRRTREIAVLKSLGMKGRHVILVFTIESVILALAGTALGLVGGIAASWVVNGVTQNLAGFSIPWSIQVEPLLTGALVGVVTTVLFSYGPIVTASRLRPVVALRGSADGAIKAHRIRAFFSSMRHQPLRTLGRVRYAPMGVIRLRKSPRARTVVLTLFLAGLMGTLASVYGGLASGSGSIFYGFRLGIGILIGALVLTQLFVGAVWIVSKMPTFGRLSLRMAFRSMNTQKRRLASTLLALCVGMLSVGSVAIVAQNFKSAIAESITHKLHIKALVSSPQNPAFAARLLHETRMLPGVTGSSFGAFAASAVSATPASSEKPMAVLRHE